MGTRISRLKPDNVPWEVLISHLASLNQDETCEADAFPHTDLDVEGEEFQNILNSRYKTCPKKADHAHFIPIKDLTLGKMPDTAKYQAALDWVNYWAASTVRLVTSYTSKYRPDRFGMASLRGTRTVRFGTGRVNTTIPIPPPPGYPAETMFYVTTAAHVVSGDDEAEKTVVQFFFTDDNNRGSIIKARGVKVHIVDIDNDACTFWCQVDDVSTAKMIRDKLRLGDIGNVTPGLKLSFTVSHPHGTAQKVSFGDVLSVPQQKSPVRKDTKHRFKLFHKQTNQKQKLPYGKTIHHYLRTVHLPAQWSDQDKALSKIPDPDTHTLTSLETQGLVTRPTAAETALMDAVWGEVEGEMERVVRSEVSDELDQWRANLLSRLELERVIKQKMSEYYKSVCANIAVPDEVIIAFGAAWTECRDIKWRCLGLDPPKQTLSSLFYNIPTCGGSSGSLIISIEALGYIGTHSSGGRRRNRSCWAFEV